MDKLAVNRKLNSVLFCLKKNSPQIFLAAGIASGVGCVVLACVQTYKASKKIDNMKNDIYDIKDAVDKEYRTEEGEVATYTEEDAKDDSIIVYRQFTIDMIKLYAPVVGFGALSIACVLKSYGIMSARNVALTAAYVSVERSFKEYRERVKKRYGEEEENDIFLGIEKVKSAIFDEDGKEVSEMVEMSNVIDGDIYTKVITYKNNCYIENIDYMTNFLNIQQNLLNDLLRKRGYLSLNDAYNRFDFEPTNAGLVVGWIFEEGNTEGDNLVQLTAKKVSVLDSDGVTVIPGYAITFNVDGNIYERLAAKY